MASNLYCPHCFKQIHTHELLYFKPSCGDKLPPPPPSFMQKAGLASTPHSILCSKNNKNSCRSCNRRLSFRACPICKGTIPSDWDGKPIIIAITGSPASGKSAYIQAATNRLRQLSEVFARTLTLCDAGSGKSTMFKLRRNQSDKGKLIVLAEREEQAFTPAVMNAFSGIIALVDPLQAEDAREEILASGSVSLPAFTPAAPQQLLSRIARSGGAALPLALTLSKIDTITTTDATYTGRWLLQSDKRQVCRDSHVRGKNATEEQETINCEMESWLATAYPPMSAAVKKIQNYRFFGCSSTEPPLRVEDPLLWILSLCKVLSV